MRDLKVSEDPGLVQQGPPLVIQLFVRIYAGLPKFVRTPALKYTFLTNINIMGERKIIKN